FRLSREPWPRTRRVVCAAVPGVVVVSDSNAYLPRRLAEVNGVHVLQQYVVHADGRREPEDEVDLEAFFEEMRSAEELPTTAHPTVEDFCAVFYFQLRTAYEIVSIHSSGALSRTVEAARDAAT